MSPIFSFVLPTYNRAWALPRCLEFIRSQDFKDWELLVVDDGSTDNTRQIVEELMKIDPRIRYMYQKNAKQAAARQNGLKQAQGEWVTYVDSDDELYPFYLSTAKQFFDHHPHVWYAFAHTDRFLEVRNQQQEVLYSKPSPTTELDPASITLRDLAHWKVKPCGTGIFHKRILPGQPVQWDTKLKLIEDLDFLLQLGLHYPDHFGFISTALFKQRQAFGGDGTCSGASYDDWASGFEQLYLKYADAWFMEGQTWYPSKVEKYRQQQKDFEAGRIGPAWQKHFPEYFNKNV